MGEGEKGKEEEERPGGKKEKNEDDDEQKDTEKEGETVDVERRRTGRVGKSWRKRGQMAAHSNLSKWIIYTFLVTTGFP